MIYGMTSSTVVRDGGDPGGYDFFSKEGSVTETGRGERVRVGA